MDGRVEREIHFHVPFQRVQYGAGARDAFGEAGIVGDSIGQDIPVAGRSFGAGTVGPEFGQYAREIAAFDDVVGVRLTRGRIERVTGAIIHAEAVVAPGAGGNVDGDTVIWRQFAAAADYLHNLVAKLSVAGAVEMRLRSRIDPRDIRYAARQRERAHSEPLRAEKALNRAGRKAVLIHGVGNRQRLPAVHVHDGRAGQTCGHWLIDRDITALVGGIIGVRL